MRSTRPSIALMRTAARGVQRCSLVALLHDDDRLAVDFADGHAPRRRRALVLAEVWRVVEASREAIGDTDARVGADQLTQAVPVAAVESFDVQLQQPGERGARGGRGWGGDTVRRSARPASSGRG